MGLSREQRYATGGVIILNMYKKFFIGTRGVGVQADGRGELGTFAWTVASGIVYSLQSLLFLIVITHILDDEAAGIYNAGMVVAQMMLTVGKYSVRNYQVSDVREQYSFADYFTFRLITCMAAMIVMFVWIAVKGYTGGIAIVAASLTVYKMAECLSDVFEGLYQQKFRFDVSGKSQFVKDLTMIIVYIGMLVITRDVVISSVVLAAVSILLIVVIDFPLTKYFGRLGVHFNMKAVKGLTIACFALFVSSFLCAYIHSAPKLAIEQYFGRGSKYVDFNALFMPTFVVDLLAGFTMRMWITKMAVCHDQGDTKTLNKLIIKQMGVIAFITVVSMLVMYFAGGWALSLLYGRDLHGYEWSNALLMLAGGMVAVYTLFENVIIIYRHQHFSIVINIVSAVATVIIMPLFTRSGGVLGATLAYLAANTIRAIGYIACALYYMNKDKKNNQKIPARN